MSGVVRPAPFVGRQRELGALRGRLEAARAGRGSLVMLAGEAGIGKTRIARAFADEAVEQGAALLWGGCFEGDWHPPYGPWVEALAGYARAAPSERLLQELGPGASVLVQLVPALRGALPELPRPSRLNPDQERLRLYDGVAEWLMRIGQYQPAVVVLDDLHWADGDTLGLLRYVVRSIGHARLLLVGLYRDPDPDLERAPMRKDVLGALRREADCEHVRLRGLSEAEAGELLALSAEQELPQALARAIFAETSGNPFYLGEVFRHLAEEGKIVWRAGRWSSDFSMGALGIPDGVRQVVDRRLARLREPTRRMLDAAAGFTGGFGFDVLQALTGLSEEALLDSLDEALEAGLIRASRAAPPTYDFAHAIVRHTIYEGLNPDRRARLHRRIAAVLEAAYGQRAADHAAELADQYHASAGPPGAERGITYCLAAAEQARASFAHEQAVTFLRMARALAAGQDGAVRADILRSLALAEADALLLEQARETAQAWRAMADEAGVAPAEVASFLARMALALKDGGAREDLWAPLVEQGLGLVGGPAAALELDYPADSTSPRRAAGVAAVPLDQAERRPDAATGAVSGQALTWARLMLLRTRFEPVASGPINVGRWPGHEPRGVAVARAQGDEEDYARTLEPYEWRQREETDAILMLARRWERPAASIRALQVVVRDLMYRWGDVREAVERAQELLALSQRHGSMPGRAEALTQLAVAQAMLGELALAQDTAERARGVVGRLGAVHRLHNVVQVALPSTLGYYLDADWRSLASAAAAYARQAEADQSSSGLVAAAFAVFNHARAGNVEQARQFLVALTDTLEWTEPRMYHRSVDVALAGTAVWELSLGEFAGTYRRMGLEILALGAGEGAFTIELTVARMAALLGDRDAAETYFARARTTLDARGLRPLRAIADYDEAVALMQGTSGGAERARAAALLESAHTRFDALGMHGWASRAKQLRAQVSGIHRAARPERTTAPGGLSAREVEVLRLLARGCTNKEIAARLCISVPTVLRHITNIYGKIGARNRAEATAYALTRGLAGGEERALD
jgi:DNA-binding CsgD family transcriptional regulator